MFLSTITQNSFIQKKSIFFGFCKHRNWRRTLQQLFPMISEIPYEVWICLFICFLFIFLNYNVSFMWECLIVHNVAFPILEQYLAWSNCCADVLYWVRKLMNELTYCLGPALSDNISKPGLQISVEYLFIHSNIQILHYAVSS